MPLLRIDLALVAVSALSIGAGGSGGSLADRSLVRDARGLPVIPGSQLKGKTRHAAEALLRGLGEPVQADFDDDDTGPNLIRMIFGSPRHPSPLRFADLSCDLTVNDAGGASLTELRPSVALSRRRGNAEDERLVLIEAARPDLTFSAAGAIEGFLEDPSHVALLWAALRLTTRWGGAKSRGLGWAEVKPTVFWDGGAEPLGEAELAEHLRALPRAGGAR